MLLFQYEEVEYEPHFISVISEVDNKVITNPTLDPICFQHFKYLWREIS